MILGFCLWVCCLFVFLGGGLVVWFWHVLAGLFEIGKLETP